QPRGAASDHPSVAPSPHGPVARRRGAETRTHSHSQRSDHSHSSSHECRPAQADEETCAPLDVISTLARPSDIGVYDGTMLELLTGAGLAAAAGLNAYIPLLAMGIAARIDWIHLPQGWTWLENEWILGILAV